MAEYGEGNKYTLESAGILALGHKVGELHRSPYDLDVKQALAFTSFGYSGSGADLSKVAVPGAHVVPNNFGPSNLANTPLTWCWEPGVPRQYKY